MNSSTPQPPETSDRLKTTEYVGYALGDTASNFFFQTFAMFLTIYYTDVWGIKAAALMWLLPLVRIVGTFDDPIIGLIADRTKSRWGKFRPYLLWGAIPYGICGYLMFAGPNLGPTAKLIYAGVTYGLMMTSYSIVNVPYSALLGVISPSSRTRAVASSFRFVGAFGGALLISFLVQPLVKNLGGGNAMTGWRWTMAIFALASVVMFWMTFATTKERVTPPPQQKTNVREEIGELFRNWPAVMILVSSLLATTYFCLRGGTATYYYKYIVGGDDVTIWRLSVPHLFSLDLNRSTIFLSTGSLGLMLGTALIGRFVRVIDKKYYACVFSAIAGLSFASFYLLPKEAFGLQVAVNALSQLCAGPVAAITWALYGDVADYGEWKFGRRSTGLVYSASLFAIKTGVVVAGFLLPWFLDRFGFEPNVAQTDRAKLGILLAFSLAPALCGLLNAVALLIFPLDQKRVDEIERDLAVRRATASAVPTPA
jgi:GPH family glycoside/pentoside/hexuronide:cation symporter